AVLPDSGGKAQAADRYRAAATHSAGAGADGWVGGSNADPHLRPSTVYWRASERIADPRLRIAADFPGAGFSDHAAVCARYLASDVFQLCTAVLVCPADLRGFADHGAANTTRRQPATASAGGGRRPADDRVISDLGDKSDPAGRLGV